MGFRKHVIFCAAASLARTQPSSSSVPENLQVDSVQILPDKLYLAQKLHRSYKKRRGIEPKFLEMWHFSCTFLCVEC